MVLRQSVGPSIGQLQLHKLASLTGLSLRSRLQLKGRISKRLIGLLPTDGIRQGLFNVLWIRRNSKMLAPKQVPRT